MAVDLGQQIASWVNPSAAVVQDKIFIAGGKQWRGDYSDGEWLSTNSYKPPGGMLFEISLCNSFNTSITSDLTKLLTTVNYTSDNEYATYIGGAMFTNDYEFYTYG